MSEKETKELADYYCVKQSANHAYCCDCGAGMHWTVVYKDSDGEEVEIGTAWEGDAGREMADDICDLMNMAFETGRESRG